MPRCATAAFPHPLVHIYQSNAEKGLTNVLSYALSDLMVWQGLVVYVKGSKRLQGLIASHSIYRLGDIINHFRTKTLGLKPLNLRSGPGLTDRLRIPWAYCMSPALVPKPDDWTNHIGEFYILLSYYMYIHKIAQTWLGFISWILLQTTILLNPWKSSWRRVNRLYTSGLWLVLLVCAKLTKSTTF